METYENHILVHLCRQKSIEEFLKLYPSVSEQFLRTGYIFRFKTAASPLNPGAMDNAVPNGVSNHAALLPWSPGMHGAVLGGTESHGGSERLARG